MTRKRFTAFLVSTALLTLGAFLIREGTFPVYAGALGTMFSVYAAGQSYTDGKEPPK